MSTTAVVPAPTISTFCLVKNDKGEIDFRTENSAAKAVEKKEGEVQATQSFKTYNVANDAEFAALVPSEKERVRLINRALDNKQYQLARSTMLETDKEGNYIFEQQEGAIDLASDVATEVAARATTPEAKVEKVLDGLDDATANAILEKLMKRRAAQEATVTV